VYGKALPNSILTNAVVQRSKFAQDHLYAEQPRGVIVTSAAEYRRRAAETEALARQMSRNDHREEALQVAADYRRRAAELEKKRGRSFRTRE
jgi:hypothetical protein